MYFYLLPLDEPLDERDPPPELPPEDGALYDLEDEPDELGALYDREEPDELGALYEREVLPELPE